MLLQDLVTAFNVCMIPARKGSSLCVLSSHRKHHPHASYSREGYEADDMIATYAALAMKEGNPVTMISPDKDMMQLVSDDARVRQFLHTKGQFVEEAEVKQKFGVLPPLVPHVQVKSIYLRDSNRGDDDQWIAGSVA